MYPCSEDLQVSQDVINVPEGVVVNVGHAWILAVHPQSQQGGQLGEGVTSDYLHLVVVQASAGENPKF